MSQAPSQKEKSVFFGPLEPRLGGELWATSYTAQRVSVKEWNLHREICRKAIKYLPWVPCWALSDRRWIEWHLLLQSFSVRALKLTVWIDYAQEDVLEWISDMVFNLFMEKRLSSFRRGSWGFSHGFKDRLESKVCIRIASYHVTINKVLTIIFSKVVSADLHEPSSLIVDGTEDEGHFSITFMVRISMCQEL